MNTLAIIGISLVTLVNDFQLILLRQLSLIDFMDMSSIHHKTIFF